MLRLAQRTWPVPVIALAPALTSWLPFELALRAQAGLIVLTLAAVALPRARRAPAAIRSMPRAVAVGLSLYLGAALWGTAVGLASGNALRDVLGQALSMLLLPAGAVAFATMPRFSPRYLVDGLCLAALAALGLQLGSLALPDSVGPYYGSFRFGTEVGSFVAAGGMVVVLASARFLRDGSRIALAGGAAGIVLLAGGMSRGAWLSTLVALFLFGVLWRGVSSRSVRLALWSLPVLAAVVVGVGAATIDAGRRLATSPAVAIPAEKTRILVRRLDVDSQETPAIEVRIRGVGPPRSHLLLWIQGREDGGRATLRARHKLAGSEDPVASSVVVLLPEKIESVRIGANAVAGPWAVETVTVNGFHSHLIPRAKTLLGPSVREPNVVTRDRKRRLVRWVEAVVRRAEYASGAFWNPRGDSSLQYRLQESSAVCAEWSRASPFRAVMGQGLGARFPFRNPTRDEHGRKAVAQEANYIHNFYLFLLFKLGVAGVIALAALLLIVAWTAWAAWKERGRPERAWFLAAAAATWAAYLLWSFTSPEILDFRLAPLWGAVVAASAGERRGTG